VHGNLRTISFGCGRVREGEHQFYLIYGLFRLQRKRTTHTGGRVRVPLGTSLLVPRSMDGLEHFSVLFETLGKPMAIAPGIEGYLCSSGCSERNSIYCRVQPVVMGNGQGSELSATAPHQLKLKLIAPEGGLSATSWRRHPSSRELHPLVLGVGGDGLRRWN